MPIHPLRQWLPGGRAALMVVSLMLPGVTPAQPRPFKLGTFTISGRDVVGVVVDDRRAIDIAWANRAFEAQRRAPAITVPDEMKSFIAAYDATANRVQEILSWLDGGATAASPPPGFVHALADLEIRAPILYPDKLLCAAVNFRAHAIEGGRDPATQERSLPYLFFKPPTTTIIAHGGTVLLPAGRDRIDWEIEMGTVIGRRAKDLTAAQIADHVFGYTIMLDISDRGGGHNTNFGSNWFPGKGHDTFAPLGPFIVPKEFLRDPHDLRMALRVNDQVMQDASSSLMIHNQEELAAYASSICTLVPGDVIAGGTPGGVGSGRTPPVFLKSGDVLTAVIEGIGTLVAHVR